MSNRSETFGRLLKGAINSIATYEGTTAPFVEEELAEKVGLAGSAIQRYKTGYLPPEPRTIEIIAEAAVRRGFFSREWLQRFLHAARYHQAEKLLDLLCPTGPARPRPPRVYQNLPAPTYSQFVERKRASAEVLEGLGKRSAAVVIVGLGGNGKTSLAREIADRCLKGEEGQGFFDAVVWVSDKDRPGTTNLSIVLDEIARTLDYPGFTQFEHDEKRREVEQLLRRQHVLVCIDNFETITDGALLSWLLNLPEPSKALITTREYRREYRRGGWPVELRGMSDSEARALVDERLHVLRIERLVADRAPLEPLMTATGGNPKAIEITLGLVKHERRPLQQVVDDLYAARGELFDDLFTRAWALLDEPARRVLLVMTFFPASAAAEALAASADVDQFTLYRAAERLTDLALLDLQQDDLSIPPRYALHPLVRSFASAKLREQPLLERESRQRWLQHLRGFALQAQERWKLGRQEVLDGIEQELLSFHAALLYHAETKSHASLIELIYLLYNVWSFRGYYEDRRRFVELALQSAEAEGASTDQIRLLCIKARTLCYLGEPALALECCTRARAILARTSDETRKLELNINYSQIRACFLIGDIPQATVLAERNVAVATSDHVSVMYAYDLVDCHYHARRLDDARSLCELLLIRSEQLENRRSVYRAGLTLGRIAVVQSRLDEAKSYLDLARGIAIDLHHRRLWAEVIREEARYWTACDDADAARRSLTEAIDLFERLGMRRELAEARAELRRLEELGEAPIA